MISLRPLHLADGATAPPGQWQWFRGGGVSLSTEGSDGPSAEGHDAPGNRRGRIGQ